MSEVNVTVDNFDEEVMKSDKPVLIDFWASWCGPCKMLAPVISEIADERTDIKVCKINVDDEEGLAARYRVSSIPTLLIIVNGEVKSTSVGAKPKAQILDWITSVI